MSPSPTYEEILEKVKKFFPDKNLASDYRKCDLAEGVMLADDDFVNFWLISDEPTRVFDHNLTIFAEGGEVEGEIHDPDLSQLQEILETLERDSNT